MKLDGRFEIIVSNGEPVQYLVLGEALHEIEPYGIIYHLYFKIQMLENKKNAPQITQNTDKIPEKWKKPFKQFEKNTGFEPRMDNAIAGKESWRDCFKNNISWFDFWTQDAMKISTPDD